MLNSFLELMKWFLPFHFRVPFLTVHSGFRGGFSGIRIQRGPVGLNVRLGLEVGAGEPRC